MLFELEPSEEVSGGTWYTDNEFDQEFITTVSDSVERFIIKKVGFLRTYTFSSQLTKSSNHPSHTPAARAKRSTRPPTPATQP